jgi:hypothetical protein
MYVLIAIVEQPSSRSVTGQQTNFYFLSTLYMKVKGVARKNM